MFLSLILILFIVCCHSYHVSSEDDLSPVQTCNQFNTILTSKEDPPNYQFQASLPPLKIQEACHTTLADADDVFLFLTTYPKHFNVKMTVTQPYLDANFTLTALMVWGSLTLSNEVKQICDIEGNMYFTSPTLDADSRFFPQNIIVTKLPLTQDSTKTFTFTDSFDLNLENHPWLGKAPILGEGLSIYLGMCQIQPPINEPQVLFKNQDSAIRLKIDIEMIHWWGTLHPEMYSELNLLCFVAFFKLLLVLWFLVKCRIFRDHVMSQQRLILFVSAFSLVGNIAFIIFLLIANNDGSETCCPIPLPTMIMLGLKLMTSMAFDLLVLATAKGWGVVKSSLDGSDQKAIGFYFVFSIVVYVGTQIFQRSVEMTWLFIITESFVWVWIFSSLKHTMNDLTTSTRLDRTSKLEMYSKLRRLLLFSLSLWCFVVLLEFFLVIAVFDSTRRIIIFDLPPTLAWDLALLFLMCGFAYVWRPSPATAQFSYWFTRQDDDSFDLRRSDPVAEFGLEST